MSESSSSMSSTSSDDNDDASSQILNSQQQVNPQVIQSNEHDQLLNEVEVPDEPVGNVQNVLGEVSESEEEDSSDSPATSSDDEVTEKAQNNQLNSEDNESQSGKKMGTESDEDETEAGVKDEEGQMEGGDHEEIIGRTHNKTESEEAVGDEDEIYMEGEEDGDHPRRSSEEQDRQQDDEGERKLMPSRLGDDEQDEEEDQGPVRIDLDIARCRANLGQEGPYFVRMPNFLSVETRPFDSEAYEDELDEDEQLDENVRNRLKLKMENTIRWRTVRDDEGNESRESNAKIVRWSDGSMSLYLGKEIFEIETQRIMDHNHLYIRQGNALQAQSMFTEKLVFRPHSTETLTHRKMTLSAAEKSSKTQKVKVLAQVGENPEAERKELIRTEEEKLRAAARREAQQRRIRERPRVTGLTPGFLEGYDSDEGGESLAAIKRRYQHAPYTSMDHRSLADASSGSDNDEEAEERDRRARKAINEAKIYSDEEDEGKEGAAGVADDSDTEQRQKQKSQQKKKIVIEDDEDL